MDLAQRAENLTKVTREFRIVGGAVRGGLQLRADGDDKLTLDGYAAIFDTPYEVEDWYGGYTEEIDRHAFDKTLQEKADVRLLINHSGIPIARTKSKTLILKADDIGLHCESALDPKPNLIQDLRSAMERGDLDEMSFSFRAMRQEWNEDWTHRKLLELRLYDVSIVTFPMNPMTSATLRAKELASLLKGGEREAVLAEIRSGGDGTLKALREVYEVLGIILSPSDRDAGDTDPTISEEPTQPDILDLRRRELELLRFGK